jgi:hypothetical protein
MKKLALPVMMLAALAACSDSPVETAAAPGDELRVIRIYDESEFKAAGITAPDARALLAGTRNGRLNPVQQLGLKGVGPKFQSAEYYPYCPVQPVAYSRDQQTVDAPHYPCEPPYEDCYTNPYGWGCGDPCQWDPYLPECQPQGPAAVFNYGSDAVGPYWVNMGGTLLKEVSLTTFSEAVSNVAFTTLDASFRNVGAQSGAGCGNATQQFDGSHSSGSGSPLLLQSSRVANYLGTIKWEVWGTHGFTPVSGASGGGTFYSSDSVCG